MTDQKLGPRPEGKESFISRNEVLKRTGMGRTSLYAEIKDGSFEPPIVLRKSLHVWLESDVDEYIRRKTEEARKGSSVFRGTRSAG